MQTRIQAVQTQINGLGVSGTVRGMRSALECIRGVERVTMTANDRCVSVTYDANTVRPAQFATAVLAIGCEVARIATLDKGPLTTRSTMPGGVRLAS